MHNANSGSAWLRGRLCILALLVLLPAPALAQLTDPCYSDPALSICGLNNTTLTHTYDPDAPSTPPPINFTSHSCQWKKKGYCGKALDYTVRVDGRNNSTNFLLSGPGNTTLPVILSYTDAAGSSLELPATGGSVNSAGSVNSSPVSISVALNVTAPQSLEPGTYSEKFVLTASQSSGCGGNCGYLSNIEFTVTINVPVRITVKRFDNINLSGSFIPGQPIEQYEDFCVGGIGFEQYTVAFSSANGSTGGAGTSPFLLAGNFDSVPYSVAFIDNTSSGSGTSADSSGNISGSFARMEGMSCNTDNARVFISVSSADWQAAVESQYTDALTITVTTQ